MDRRLSNSLQARIKKFQDMKRTLPILIANDALKHFVGSFKNEGFTDSSLKKWPEVQRRIPGYPSYKYPKTLGLGRRTRKILIGTSSQGGSGGGGLFGAVQNSKKKVSFEEIIFQVSVPYARFHNWGEGQKQRKFIGYSKSLDKKIQERIKKSMGSIK